MAVAIKIGHRRSERRRELRLHGQRPGFKSAAPIEKDHRIERRRGGLHCQFEFRSQNFRHARLAESAKSTELLLHKRQCLGDRIQVAPRHHFVEALVKMRLQHLAGPAAIEVAEINPQRLRQVALVFVVAPPVARHDVQPAVAVEISRRHSVPPALVFVQAQFGRDFAQFPASIRKHPHRSPLARQNQLGQPIPVQIAPHRPADHPHPGQAPRVLGVQLPSSTDIPKQH